MNKNSMIWLAVAVIIGLGLTYLMRSGGAPKGVPVAVRLPQLSEQAMAGRAKFEANCMRCHGKNAAGTGKGPPLIHKIYEPNHHADLSFHRAVKNGVRAHHWRYGNMPPLSGIKEEDITQIIRYVRELQRANGIF